MVRRVTELAPGIVVAPTVRLGRPVIRGTRVPVDVVVQLAAGLSAEQVAEEYPCAHRAACMLC